jgi:hypothetical protein
MEYEIDAALLTVAAAKKQRRHVVMFGYFAIFNLVGSNNVQKG